MKRKVFILLVLFLLLLTSCNKVANNTDTGKNDMIQEAEDQISNETEQSNTINEDNSIKTSDSLMEKNYDVVEEKYDDNGIKITYPQIIKLNDNDKQKKNQ